MWLLSKFSIFGVDLHFSCWNISKNLQMHSFWSGIAFWIIYWSNFWKLRINLSAIITGASFLASMKVLLIIKNGWTIINRKRTRTMKRLEEKKKIKMRKNSRKKLLNYIKLCLEIWLIASLRKMRRKMSIIWICWRSIWERIIIKLTRGWRESILLRSSNS